MARRTNTPLMEQKIKRLYHRLGLKYNLSDETIKNIIESQYEFIKKTIIALDVRTPMTDEEFDKLKTNFMLKHFGKLYTNNRILRGIRERVRLINILNEKKRNGEDE